MVKLNEADSEKRKAILSYVEEKWAKWAGHRISTLNRALNYLFVLNTGGLLVGFTYIAAAGVDTGTPSLSIYAFSAGLCCVLMHAAFDYYSMEYHLKLFMKNVEQLYDNTLDWEEFEEKERNNVPRYVIVSHVLGLASFLLFLFGLGNGVFRL